MAAAHQNEYVIEAAGAFLAAPVRGMVELLAKCLYNYFPARDHRAIVLGARMDSVYHPLAYQMLAATNAIYQMDRGTRDEPGPRTYARGAVVEQIAEGLLRVRKPELLTEQCVGPLDGKHWKNEKSDSIDFVVKDAPQELWDAKSDIFTIKSRHINQFDLLLDIADAGAMAGFITLDERATLVDFLSDFTGFRHPLYAYVFENFETMTTARSITRVDSWAPDAA